ncbi:MAG TPA: 4-hydroxybenzoate octaprenyltransferase [Pseudomonadales bacterium]
MSLTVAHLPLYYRLMRFDRPIGSLLLLWPTLWALWLAAGGVPQLKNLVIFVVGCLVMRAAGCVINDYADRHIDRHVKRTKDRPLTTGQLGETEALTLFFALCGLAFLLVLFTNWLTVLLSFGGAALAALYPFMKRYTYFPQVVLGAAFSWSVVMAFAAEQNAVPRDAWLIYVAVTVWTVVYDTFYAMVDRDDDLRIGVKSTAILFGDYDRLITAFLQLFVMFVLILIGYRFQLGIVFYLSTIVTACLFAWQQVLVQFRRRDDCFRAFLNNQWVGLVIFAGIALDYAVR